MKWTCAFCISRLCGVMVINGLRLTRGGRAKADLFVYLFTMMSEQEMDSTLKGLFEGLEFQAEPAGLYDPLRYMMSIGGKRIRPRLCLLAFSLFDEVADGRILEPAAGLEIFHAFTLLHDDIMDKSDTRRGHETVWKRWDVNTAILSGDVMSIESFRRMAAAPREVLPLVLSVFTKTAAQVCDGQQMDMDFETRERVPMAEYMEMIGLKTAVLLACSARIGALIGGASSFEAQALYDYGYDLGLAFQIADDYLDVYADPAVFGKPVGGDIRNNKKSWMLLRAFEKAADPAGLEAAMRIEDPQAKYDAVRGIYDALDVAGDARVAIARYTEKALSHVKELDREGALARFAQSLVGRVK